GVGIAHGLRARFAQVDDRQPSVGQSNVLTFRRPDPRAVGSTRRHSVPHAMQLVTVYPWPATIRPDAGNAAHAEISAAPFAADEPESSRERTTRSAARPSQPSGRFTFSRGPANRPRTSW